MASRGAILLRFLISFLFAAAVMLAAAPTRAADYQVIWHQPDMVLLVDTDASRQTAPGLHEIETVDLMWAEDHPVAYRHRTEIDCAGGRMRLLVARQVPIRQSSDFALLEATMPPSRPQGWYAALSGSASGRALDYVCNRNLVLGDPRRLVRRSSPTEAVSVYVRQWCPDCGKDKGLTEERWKAWRVAFDHMGLPDRDPPWLAAAKGIAPIAIVVGVWIGLGWLARRLRPLRPGVLQSPPLYAQMAVLGVLLGGAAFYGAQVSAPDQVLWAYLCAAAFLPIGLFFGFVFVRWRVVADERGFTYRGLLGRETYWPWSGLEAVGPRAEMRGVYLLRMTDGRVVKITMLADGLSEFLDLLGEAKGWEPYGPNEPVIF